MSPFQFGSHSPMASFASVFTQHRRPLQILTTRVANEYGPYIVQHTPSSSTSLNIALSHSPSEFLRNPIGIIGGASSTIAANTDVLSVPALVTMFLLAIQYCAQPPITRKFLDSRANKKGITMVEEIIKMGLAGFFFINCGKTSSTLQSYLMSIYCLICSHIMIHVSLISGKDVVSAELHGWTLSSSLLLAGLRKYEAFFVDSFFHRFTRTYTLASSPLV